MSSPRAAAKRNPLPRRAKTAPLPRTAAYWRDGAPAPLISPGRSLVIEDSRPFVLHFGRDGWSETSDRFSVRLRSGAQGVRLEATELHGVRELNFTRFYPDDDRWEGVDHVLVVRDGARTNHPES